MNVKNLVKLGVEASKDFFKKHGHVILLATGSAATVGATVWAVRNTIKHDTAGVFQGAKAEIEAINDTLANEGEDYDKADARRDTLKVIGHTAVETVKIYIGPAILEVGSIAAFVGANHILYRRAASLATAYASLEAAFRAYRERVAARFGDKVEEQIRYAIHEEEIERLETDEKGHTKKSKEKVEVSTYDGYSAVARYYDKTCEGCWTESAPMQDNFINGQLQMAQDLLTIKKVLTQNDVYDLFNMEKSVQGLTLGWVEGDVVEFHPRRVRRPVIDKDTQEQIGWEPAILIDFNSHDISGFLPMGRRQALAKIV